MKKVEEVIVFTKGDSGKLSTWSNIPYFFTETLISKGIKVNRVNIGPSRFLNYVYKQTFYKIILLVNKQSTYNYLRSYTYFIETRIKIKLAIKKYPNADANIFLTFSFSSAGLSTRPAIQIGDWTYDHYFKYFLSREPDYFERQCIKREDSQIEESDFVFPLFPSVSKYMKERYRNKNIFYLGNVINSLYNVEESDIIEIKRNSNKILFVGKKKYFEGAISLISAFEILKPDNPGLTLHIIGMESIEFQNLPKDVFCYGYLNKGEDTDRELYYKLFKEAKIFVNTTPNWSAFSASIEAMYFYNPVVVPPYDEFIETFGSNISFGYYCDQNSPALIAEYILKVFSNYSYENLCRKAHEAVEQFTWSTYVDKLLQKVEGTINKLEGGV